LWDGSGEVDSEIAHLEAVLGELRWKPRGRRLWRWWGVAAAAVLLLAAGISFFPRRGPVTSWELSLAGGKESVVRGGEVIETGSSMKATMKSEAVGEVNIDPNSRLRVVEARAGLQKFALDQGTIHAFIWARPATFVVDTPSAKTVDLGCQYTLRVDKDGSGFLSVETGWVAFEAEGVESFIPADAVCSTRQGRGPNTPYFRDAPKALSGALAEFDQSKSSAALRAVLAAARARDAFTLWHLLQRTKGEQRLEIYERFAGLVNLPASATQDGILHGDPNAMDAAWNALQLGDMAWWRTWQRKW
jgi:hypothetical protein